MKNVKFNIMLNLFLFLFPVIGFTFDLSGTVIAENNSSISDSTVILTELDKITETDSEGWFEFQNIPEGYYTLLVIAPGYQQKEFTGISPEAHVTLDLVPEIIEMDPIIIKAEKEALEKIDAGVTSEELEKLPTGSDPFDAVIMEEGVLGNLNILTAAVIDNVPQNYTNAETLVLPEGRLSKTKYDNFSVYGGEPEWNNYYYDYIRIPMNKHVFGFPEAEPVIPIGAVESIDFYHGAYPIEYGPGIGGCFVINPVEAATGWQVELTPTTTQLEGISTISFTSDISLLVSIKQAILNLTTIPLINMLLTAQNEEDLNSDSIPTSINYGDALLSLRLTPPDHEISVDFLGFYDSWGFDLNVRDSFFKMNNFPYFLSLGSKWVWSITPETGNILYLFGSLYKDTGSFDYDFRGEAFSNNISVFNQDWVSMVKSLQGGEEFQLAITPELLLLTGITGRLSSLYGVLTDVQYVENSEGLILVDYDHSILVEDILSSVYGYGKIIGNIEDFDFHLGTGCLWYPETMNIRPAVEGEAIYSMEKISFALTGGWSPGIIDEFSYIDRRLDEKYYKLNTSTIADQPPMTITGAGQAVFLLGEEASFKVSPYYSWYYDLTGLSLSSSYTDLDQKFISLEPSEGYSTGIDIKWSDEPLEYLQYDISYAFSWTRYMTEDLGWTAPNTEVQHVVKSSALYKNEGFKIGLNLLIYCGQPFTPEVVESSSSGPVIVSGIYNSAYNYVPSYELTANFSWENHAANADTKLFFNSSNLVDGLNFSMFGLKEEFESTIGASSADFNSRNYTFDYTLTDLLILLLTCEIGFSISF